MNLPRILAAFTLLLITSGSGFAQTAKRIPLASSIDKVQPMTGIVLWSDHDQAATDAIALEYRYCGYDEVVQPNGQYNFAKIDRVLDEIAGRGHQAVLRFRFVYPGKETTVPDSIRLRPDYRETNGKSEGKETSFCDWGNQALQDFTLDFYTKFAARYDNDPRIAFLQTGFGLWAEYHIYSGPRKIGKTFPDKKYQAKFLKHMDRQFKSLPWSISVDSADYDYSPLEDNDELLALDFGVFDDSFLCKPHPKENAVNWKILSPSRWKRQPGGGEFSYYNKKDQKKALSQEGPNGVSFEVSAKQFHITYMIGNDQPQYQSMKRIKSASMAIGYRFRVTAAELSGGNLRIQVTNDGVAPIYRDAFFAAGGIRSKTSLRGLLPGETKDCLIIGVSEAQAHLVEIQSDAILPAQIIQFSADLK